MITVIMTLPQDARRVRGSGAREGYWPIAATGEQPTSAATFGTDSTIQLMRCTQADVEGVCRAAERSVLRA